MFNPNNDIKAKCSSSKKMTRISLEGLTEHKASTKSVQ